VFLISQNHRCILFYDANKQRIIMSAKFLSSILRHSSSQNCSMASCSRRQGCSKSKPGTPFLLFFRLLCLWAVPSSACQTQGQSARGCAQRLWYLCLLGHTPSGSILCRALSGTNQSHTGRDCSQQPCSCCYKPQINGTEGSDASYALKGATTGQFSATLVALGQACLISYIQSAVVYASCI